VQSSTACGQVFKVSKPRLVQLGQSHAERPCEHNDMRFRTCNSSFSEDHPLTCISFFMLCRLGLSENVTIWTSS